MATANRNQTELLDIDAAEDASVDAPQSLTVPQAVQRIVGDSKIESQRYSEEVVVPRGGE